MYKKILIIWLAATMSVIGRAELRDPTKPHYPAQIETTAINHDAELILSAIWISSKTRRATINGVSVKQGQTILDGVKIIRIRHNSVTLKQNGVIKTLQLLRRPYKTK